MKCFPRFLVLFSLCFLLGTAFGQETYFAKYKGVDGESTDENHDRWIDIHTFEWGVMPNKTVSRLQRSGTTPKVEDFVISFSYEKSALQLVEASLKGGVFPSLEFEAVRVYGGARAAYLKYECKNVHVTAYSSSGRADSQGHPIVFVANSFDEAKITYSHYLEDGTFMGHYEMEWKADD